MNVITILVPCYSFYIARKSKTTAYTLSADCDTYNIHTVLNYFSPTYRSVHRSQGIIVYYNSLISDVIIISHAPGIPVVYTA